MHWTDIYVSKYYKAKLRIQNITNIDSHHLYDEQHARSRHMTGSSQVPRCLELCRPWMGARLPFRFMLLCIPSAISIHSSLRIFHCAPSLTHRTYLPYNFFPSLLTTARGSLSQPHTYTMFYSTYTSVLLPLFHRYSIHIPHSHYHSIHNIIQSFPFTGTNNTVPPGLPPSPRPHQPLILYINLGSQYP